jgi:hypothetical protein
MEAGAATTPFSVPKRFGGKRAFGTETPLSSPPYRGMELSDFSGKKPKINDTLDQSNDENAGQSFTSPTAGLRKKGLAMRSTPLGSTPLGTGTPAVVQQQQQQLPPPRMQPMTPRLLGTPLPATPVATPKPCLVLPQSVQKQVDLAECRPRELPCTPVSQRSLSGAALLVPFGRSSSGDDGAPATPGGGHGLFFSPRATVAPTQQQPRSWLDYAKPQQQWHPEGGAPQQPTYAALVAAGPPERATASQIEVDIVRTNLGDDGKVEARRDALRRVLHAFSHHDPTTGYVQGMDAVAAAAMLPHSTGDSIDNDGFLAVAEEQSFWWLVHVTSTLLHGFFSKGMPALWLELHVLRNALVAIRPKLVSHLDALGFDFSLLAPSWYLTLFQRILDPSEVVPTLTALATQKLECTHVALGIVLAVESQLLKSTEFDQAATVLCGTVCASRTRCAPTGVLAHAAKALSLLPPKKLGALRRDHSTVARAAALSAVGSSEPSTPRSTARKKWGWW